MKKITSSISTTRNGFKFNIGTMNKKNPLSIYFEGITYLTPVDEMATTPFAIRTAERRIEREIQKTLAESQYFANDYILNFDIAKDRLVPNKSSFFTFQCFLRQQAPKPLDLKDINQATSETFGTMMDNIEKTLGEEGYTLSNKKRTTIY